MLWTPISALAASVAIVGTASSVIVVKQGLSPQMIRTSRSEQPNIRSKDIARLPAGLRELPAPQVLVDETTIFAFPPPASDDELRDTQPDETLTMAAIAEPVFASVPLPAPRVAPRAVAPPPRKFTRPSRVGVRQQVSKPPQNESWLSRLGLTRAQPAAAPTVVAARNAPGTASRAAVARTAR